MSDQDTKPIDPRQALGLEPEQLPRHIAVIMDGNGRWARGRDKPRVEGHVAGAANTRRIITHCARLGIEALTLYSFSTENWKRPKEEVDALMRLYAENLIRERPTIMENNLRLMQVGRREGLPDFVIRELQATEEMSRENTGLKLCLAINYGARQEILDAVRGLATKVADGKLDPQSIDEEMFSDHLYTAGLPDPDLLIRTAGQMRISNFLLWQISYAELFVSEVYWPDFSPELLNEAILAFAHRDRRFGGIKPAK